MDKMNFMNSVPIPRVKKSVFNLDHFHNLSCNMGDLVPVMVFDAVPGEKFNVSNEALIRFAPLVSPMYQRINATFHTWFVPYRILWDNWDDYITETKTAGVLPAFPFVQISSLGTNYTRLLDHLGIPDPTLVSGVPVQNEDISAMRLAAVQCVYNEFYRDENLTPEVDWKLVDGDNTGNADLFVLRRRAWQHDYFTSNLPFAQKGDAVKMPVSLEDTLVRRASDPALGTPPGEVTSDLTVTNVSFPVSGAELKIDNVLSSNPLLNVGDNLYSDNSSLTGSTTINEFRLAYQLQRYLERAARAGTRLVEWIKGMFDTTLPDYTAQRPQYVGGSVSPVQISEVLNTAGIVGELPQGNMSGRAISHAQGKNSAFVAREHGVFITLMSVMPETLYQQGIEREWKKINDPKDFMNPMFTQLGEQATEKSELLAFMTHSQTTFGYLPRYAEYRTIPNRVSGEFRTTLDYWHMSRIFDPVAGVTLDNAFVSSDPTHRVFADTDPHTDKLYVQVMNRVRAVRPLPKYGTPAL